MSVTYSNIRTTNSGSQSSVLTDITLDSSYPSGGYSIKAKDVGLSLINRIKAQLDDGYLYSATYPSPDECKLVVYDLSAGGGLIFNGTQFATETITISHDAAASTNGAPFSLIFNPYNFYAPVMLTDISQGDVAVIFTDSLNLYGPCKGMPITNAEVKVVYNADPVVNLQASRLYFRVLEHTRYYVSGIFVSNNNSTADSTFESVGNNDTWPVIYDANAGSYPTDLPLSYDDTKAAGERFLTDSLGMIGDGYYVCANSNGFPYIRFNVGAGIDLYFDDDAADPANRLCSVNSLGVDSSDDSNSYRGVEDIVYQNNDLISIYCDPTQAAEDCLIADLSTFGGFTFYANFGNRRIKIVHDATPSVNGFQVFVDGDKGGPFIGGLLYNNTATGTDKAYNLDSVAAEVAVVPSGTITGGGSFAEVAPGTDLSSVTLPIEIFGF